MEKENRLFEKFVELRASFTMDDLVLIFTKKKALCFEALRLKFFNCGVQNVPA